jgi:hypothetical protein
MEQNESITSMIFQEEVIKASITILFIICLIFWSIELFEYVRYIAMIGFGILSYKEKDSSKIDWIITWLISSLLICPFLNIQLIDELWKIAISIWIGLLVYSSKINIIKKEKTKLAPKEEENPSSQEKKEEKKQEKIDIKALLNDRYFERNTDDYESKLLDFLFFRWYYQPIEKTVEIYNNEIEIGLTGESLQTLSLVVLHVIFLEYFDKSPIKIIDNKTLEVKGKVYLTKNGNDFEIINRKLRIV